MKVLLVNGSPNERGCTYTALREVADTLEKEAGIEAEIFWIGMKPVYGCIACSRCRDVARCIFVNDCANEMLEKMQEADGVIVGSPVFYGGPNGALCTLLDRVFYAGAYKLAGKPAASVVSCRRGGASAAFDRLNKYFTMSNMPLVTSQYWNQVHGFTPEDVRKDVEGLQTMRTLARNMAYMLQCRQAAAEAGIPLPRREMITPTNFIRG